jgi:Zn-dependent M28 family amino/carboxypeptidase
MRRIILTTSLLAAASLAIFVAVPSAKSAPQSKPKAAAKVSASAGSSYGNSDVITQEELKIYLYFLASDQLEGRNLPSRGYDTAALYVASHLAEWGLKPGGSTSGTNGPLQPYFMPFELVTKSVIAEQSKASLTAPGGAGGRGGRGGGGGAGAGGARRGGGGANAESRTTDFEYAKDWTIAGGGRGAAPLDALDLSGKLAFAGNGYIINKTSIDPFQGIDVKGKIVVVAGLPAELAAQQNAGRGGGRGANPLGEACKDFMNPEQAAAKNGALAVITIPSFQQLTQQANPNAGGFGGGGGGRGGLNGPNYTVPKLRADAACPAVPSINAGLTLTNALFQGEKESAQQVFYEAGGNAKQTSFELAAEKSIKLHVAVKSESNHAENVIGILEGGDPVKKNEYVIMSAHLDHVGIAQPDANGHGINNGADDDGSGSAGLMAVARSYAEGAAKGMRPDRTIIFLWNAGEEKGLWGSQYFNEYPPVDLSKVVVDLNMDMIGRTKGPGFTDPDVTHVLAEPGEMMVIGPNISSDDLEKTLESVNNNYQKLKLNHFWDATKPDETHDNLGPQPNGQRVFYRSDHYNFAKMGIPIAFFTTGLHPDYHRTTDTPDKIDYKEMQVISKTLAAVGWTIANQQGRPQLKDLPEQLIKDMKTAKDQGWGKITPVLAPLPGEPY